jgi:hypothetical protein
MTEAQTADGWVGCRFHAALLLLTQPYRVDVTHDFRSDHE